MLVLISHGDIQMTETENPKAYDALGRFVEAFEQMVNDVRKICVSTIMKAATLRGMWQEENSLSAPLEDLLYVIFYHQGLTAKPLFEMLRAMIAQMVLPHYVNPHNEDKDTFIGVLTNISKEYLDLSEMRNNLLHGTWFIEDNPTADKFLLRKFTASKHGLIAVEGLPKNIIELTNLRHRCNETRKWINALEKCLVEGGNIFEPDTLRIGHLFEQRVAGKDREWVLINPSGERTTLPQK
jgi:hypothetical protein